MWRCWPFATLLANAPERCVRCADRERHRESRPRGEHMRVSTASRRGGVRVRCGEAIARWRPLPRTAAIVERESLCCVMFRYVCSLAVNSNSYSAKRIDKTSKYARYDGSVLRKVDNALSIETETSGIGGH